MMRRLLAYVRPYTVHFISGRRAHDALVGGTTAGPYLIKVAIDRYILFATIALASPS